MTLTASDALAAATTPHGRYLDAAQAALEACIAGAVPFSADTVRALIPAEAGEGGPNVLPALFGVAAKARRITRIDATLSSRRSRNGSRIAIWIKGPNA
jgi:hypothetical protein